MQSGIGARMSYLFENTPDEANRQRLLASSSESSGLCELLFKLIFQHFTGWVAG